jgi:mutator protein MutT
MTKFFLAAHGLIVKKGKYLVTRRSAINDYMPLKWDIPGGYVEKGETVEDALQREIKEEVALKVEIKQPLFIFTNLSQLPNKQVFQAVYLCEYVSGEVITNPEEHDKFAWTDAAGLSRFDNISFLQTFIEQHSHNLK